MRVIKKKATYENQLRKGTKSYEPQIMFKKLGSVSDLIELLMGKIMNRIIHAVPTRYLL